MSTLKYDVDPGGYEVYYNPPDGACWVSGASWLEVAGMPYRLQNGYNALTRDLGTIRLSFTPEPTNRHDPGAIQVLADGVHIGYVARDEQPVVRAALADPLAVPMIRKVYIDQRGTPYIHYAFCAPKPPPKPKRPKSIKIACPGCGQHYELKPPREKSVAECEKCGAPFTVSPWEPPPPELRPVQFASVSVPPPIRRRSASAGCLSVVLVAMLFFAFAAAAVAR